MSGKQEWTWAAHGMAVVMHLARQWLRTPIASTEAHGYTTSARHSSCACSRAQLRAAHSDAPRPCMGATASCRAAQVTTCKIALLNSTDCCCIVTRPLPLRHDRNNLNLYMNARPWSDKACTNCRCGAWSVWTASCGSPNALSAPPCDLPRLQHVPVQSILDRNMQSLLEAGLCRSSFGFTRPN